MANETKFSVDVQAVTVDNAVQAYSGRDGKCCCGCAGKYYVHPKHEKLADARRGYACPEDVNLKMVTKVLRTMQANEEAVEVLSGGPEVMLSLTLGARLYMLTLTGVEAKEVPAAVAA